MQNKSIRVRTTPGIDKNIRVELNQDFDFIEILSLKIAQEDIYESFCADYGVLVGRVISNRGFGVPNAKVSVFIPITSEDEKNDLIATLYPYKTITSKSSDGYRYNLFLSEKTCSINQTIGTFPTKEEVLTNDIQLEIFDKYYRYTTKTNSSGDYIIFGVPTGQQTIHLDVDLSDIGILSVRPYEMIEQGFSEKLFNGYTQFKQSTNLDELPQIKTQNKGIEIVPFWGDEERCNFGITRVDFDTGLDIIPSSVFIGSVFTDNDKNSLKQNCAVKNDMGEQCNLVTRGGVIDVLKLNYDDDNNPIEIEKYTPSSGNELIDEDGTFTFTLPMYYDRIITDEFGNLVPAIEPGIGIPTKGKYRFKIKFNEAGVVKKQTTASLIVPSLSIQHGGSEGTEQQRWTDDITQYSDVNFNNYANWLPYFNAYGIAPFVYPPSFNPNIFGGFELAAITLFTIQQKIDGGFIQNPETPIPYTKTTTRDLDLDFHTFEWKQVYTLSQFIKKVKKGSNRFSHIGIKGCDECDTNNFFPYTTAIKKSSLMFFLTSQLIKLMYFFYRIIIILGNIRICGSYRILANGDCRKLIDVAPFAFIINLINSDGGLNLECGDTSYSIPTGDLYCNSSCSCNGNPIEYGNGTGNTPCCLLTDGSCDTGTCIGFTISIPNINTCGALEQLEEWKCCSILNSARENKAIRFSFHDAWVNGTAYLYQFKAKVKPKSDGTIKYKFCGPGGDNSGGNNYVNFDNYSNCSEGNCMIISPSINSGDWNYVGGTIANAAFLISPLTLITNPTSPIEVPKNSPGIVNGANDSGEFIYCNWGLSTKIISLGPIEMCDDAYEDIQNCIFTNTENLAGNTVLNCDISDLRLGDGINPYTGDNYGVISPYLLTNPGTPTPTYNAPQVIKVGTGGESGFDRQEVTKKLNQSSYSDPEEVLIYYLGTVSCDFGDLFTNGGGCHEYELEDNIQKGVRKICQIQNEVNVRPPQNPDGTFNYEAPEVWDVGPSVAQQAYNDPNVVSGPFEVDEVLENRYHPNPETDTSNTASNTNYFTDLHVDTKTNMPYFYFGIVPGKSAIDKFRKKFLIN